MNFREIYHNLIFVWHFLHSRQQCFSHFLLIFDIFDLIIVFINNSLQKQLWRCSIKELACRLTKNRTPFPVFSYGLCKNLESGYSIEHLWTTDSALKTKTPWYVLPIHPWGWWEPQFYRVIQGKLVMYNDVI